MGKRFTRQNGENMKAFQARMAAELNAERAARGLDSYGNPIRKRRKAKRPTERNDDPLDNLDNLGESPDY